MRENDPAAMFEAAGDRSGDAAEDVADRRARAARIRQRSLELIEALGADHPLVTEARARADALDAEPGDADTMDLRSSADLAN